MKPLKEGQVEEESTFVFDKTKQYGLYAEIVLSDSIVYYGAAYYIVGFKEWGDEAIELAKKWLQKDMDKCVPAEYQVWVDWITKQPTNGDPLGKNGTFGWKYTPENMRRKTLKCDKLAKAKL